MSIELATNHESHQHEFQLVENQFFSFSFKLEIPSLNSKKKKRKKHVDEFNMHEQVPKTQINNNVGITKVKKKQEPFYESSQFPNRLFLYEVLKQLASL